MTPINQTTLLNTTRIVDEQSTEKVAKSQAQTSQASIVVDNSPAKSLPPTAGKPSNCYQPPLANDSLAPTPEVLTGLMNKFDELASQLPSQTAAVSGTSSTSGSDTSVAINDMALIAMIMLILQDLLPKLMVIMSKLNASYNELTSTNFELAIESASIGYECSKTANQQTILAAGQNLASELTGASIDVASSVGSIGNNYWNNQKEVQTFQDKKTAFESLDDKVNTMSPLLSSANGKPSNVDTFKSLLNEADKGEIDGDVLIHKKELTKTNEQHLADLKTLDKKNISGAKREENLKADLEKIDLKGNEQILNLAKDLQAKQPKSSLTAADLTETVPEFSDKKIRNLPLIKNLLSANNLPEDSILKSPIVKLNDNQTLAMLPDSQGKIGLYHLVAADPATKTPAVFLKISDVELTDHDLSAAFNSGHLYKAADLNHVVQQIQGLDPSKLTSDQQTAIKGLGDLNRLHPAGFDSLFSNNKLNVIADGKLFLLDPDFATNGKVIIKQLNPTTNKLEVADTRIVQAGMRNKFSAEYAKAQEFTVKHLVQHLDDADLIKAYVEEEPESALTAQIKDKENLPAAVKLATLAKAELDINGQYIRGANQYLQSIKSAVKLIGSRIQARHDLTESWIRLFNGASKLATANITYDAKIQEADARLMESFGQMLDRVISTVGKSNDSFADEFAKFLSQLRDAIIQQLNASTQLLTRYYSRN